MIFFCGEYFGGEFLGCIVWWLWFSLIISSWVPSRVKILFIYGRSHIDCSSSNVLEHLALPIRSTSLDPSCKNIKQICSPPRAHLFSLCMGVELLGRTIWDKSEVLLGTSWWKSWELGEWFGNPKGTLWEQGKETKTNPLSSPQKKKRDPSWMHA